MNNNFFKTLTLLVLTVIGNACSSYKVVHFSNSVEPGKDFNTYQIENLKLSRDVDEMMEKPELIKELENEINLQMQARKYQQGFIKPDLILRYEIIANQISEYSTNNYNTYRPGFYNPYGGLYRGITRREFTESILLLELRDYETDKILWQGSLDMRYSRRTKNVPNIVADGVFKIFETYPYKANTEE